MRNLAVSGMRRIKSTSSNFWKRKPFFGSSHYFGREIIFKHKMFSRKREKSALSSDETEKSARPRHRNFDQQRTRAIEKKRISQTYPGLNKKKTFIIEVCQASRGLIFTMLVFLSLKNCFEILEILDTVETRLSQTA